MASMERTMTVVLLVVEAACVTEGVLTIQCSAPERGLGDFAVEALERPRWARALLFGLSGLAGLLCGGRQQSGGLGSSGIGIGVGSDRRYHGHIAIMEWVCVVLCRCGSLGWGLWSPLFLFGCLLLQLLLLLLLQLPLGLQLSIEELLLLKSLLLHLLLMLQQLLAEVFLLFGSWLEVIFVIIGSGSCGDGRLPR